MAFPEERTENTIVVVRRKRQQTTLQTPIHPIKIDDRKKITGAVKITLSNLSITPP